VNRATDSGVSRIVAVLLLVVLARAAVHLIHWPVFEGPDEPFHLDRALSYADSREPTSHVSRGVSAAIRSHPCGRDLTAVGCPPFNGQGAFNILWWGTPWDPSRSEVVNYEMHQPPLYYLTAGTLLRALPASAGQVEASLLFLRVLSFFLFAAGVLMTLHLIESPDHRIAMLVALLLPGAIEALIRVSNDALLFLWAALLLAAWRARNDAALIALTAVGPMVKLSAFALCGAVIGFSWFSRRYGAAMGCALGSLLVFPVQWLRGWGWGGTYELNVVHAPLQESVTTFVTGLGRSIYTFGKTIFWIGGWSFFRSPTFLVIVFFVLIVMLFASCSRRPASLATVAAHLTGISVAILGFVVLAILNRKLFGNWGGLGGWYFWGWFPWLSVAGSELLFFRRGAKPSLLTAWLLFVLLANVSWFGSSLHLYGWTPR
jgi:hypothetical protein